MRAFWRPLSGNSCAKSSPSINRRWTQPCSTEASFQKANEHHKTSKQTAWSRTKLRWHGTQHVKNVKTTPSYRFQNMTNHLNWTMLWATNCLKLDVRLMCIIISLPAIINLLFNPAAGWSVAQTYVITLLSSKAGMLSQMLNISALILPRFTAHMDIRGGKTSTSFRRFRNPTWVARRHLNHDVRCFVKEPVQINQIRWPKVVGLSSHLQTMCGKTFQSYKTPGPPRYIN